MVVPTFSSVIRSLKNILIVTIFFITYYKDLNHQSKIEKNQAHLPSNAIKAAPEHITT